jgi:DNA-binding transcriptional regulator YhcF (GntR family)
MEFHKRKAIYLQISDMICEDILLQKWKKGDRIPSVRELAVNLEVNPNTIMRTYTYLQEIGIIFNQRGIGYFIADNALDITKKIKTEYFTNNELPTFFKTMDLLGVTFEDIKKYYQNRE